MTTSAVSPLSSYIYKKNQLIDLQEHLEHYCNVLPVFVSNSAKYHMNLIKSFLLAILGNERGVEPTVIEKTNKFICFKFGEIQLLDTKIFFWWGNKS